MVTPEDLDFQAIAAQAPVAWSVVDLEGNQVVGNEAYAALFGYSMEELSGLHVSHLAHPDERSATAAQVARLASGAADRLDTDKRYVRRDGTEFVGHLVASLMRDAGGAAQAIVGVVTDVTHERSLARQVEQNEERLRKMLTNISETVSLLRADGTVEATTGFHTEIMGYPADFWAGLSIFDLVHPDQRADAEALAEEVLASPGGELFAEFRVRHQLGHYEDIEFAVVNLLEDPAVAAVVITSRNVTERREQERELVRVRDRAVELANKRAAFVADVSHELRTPLHAVRGLVELLEESGLDEGQREVVETLTAETERLSATVADLVDHARIEADGLVLEPEPVRVRELMDAVVRRSEASEHAAGLELHAEVDEHVPEQVLLDGHRVDQVLTNLVDNAVKFTTQGSVSVHASVSGQTLELRVVDTGRGIPVDFRDEVFEPFTQVPGATSTVEGSGLGLALVRGLVKLMGGTVAFRSVTGTGTTFEVSLPFEVLDDTDTSGDGRRVRLPVEPTGVAVLVVEDNPTNQLLAQRQLERLGHGCDIAPDGETALTMLTPDDHGYDIVLMDWQLPDIDGLETTRRVRSLEAGRPPVPIIAVTASAMPADRLACRAAGMDDFLPKPVGLADLSGMIDRWVVRHGSDRAGRVSGGFDLTRLERLVDDLGDRDAVVSLVSSYLKELDTREALLSHAVDDVDLDVLHRVGHTLRSTSEMLGADELVRCCHRMEEAEETTDLRPLMTQFSRAAAGARHRLRAWLGQLDPTTGSHGAER